MNGKTVQFDQPTPEEAELEALFERSWHAAEAIRSILEMLGDPTIIEITLARVVGGYLAESYCDEHLAEARDEMIESIDKAIGEEAAEPENMQ